jgi:hypothetical protein
MSGSMGPDDGFERLLRGETPKTPEEQSLGLFLEDVRGAFPTEPSLQEGAQLAAIVQAAQLLADNGEPSVRSATEAGRRVPGRPMRRRVIVKLPLMRSLAAKVVAGLVVLMSMFGGLALAGALPGQDSGEDETGVVEIQDVETDEPFETEAPETEDADDQGEDADDQGEDADDQGEDADDQGENEDADDADDQGENEDADVDADDQGENEDADDQGENEDADDQGEDADDQGEDADDQGENEDQGEDD